MFTFPLGTTRSLLPSVHLADNPASDGGIRPPEVRFFASTALAFILRRESNALAPYRR